MPFFLEAPDQYANVNLTRVHLDVLAPDDIHRHYREYCWVLEGTISGGTIAIRGPRQAQAFDYSPVSLGDYFEVEGPSRMISMKEYVQLYNESRRRRRLPPFQWDGSVYRCIRDLDEDDMQKKE